MTHQKYNPEVPKCQEYQHRLPIGGLVGFRAAIPAPRIGLGCGDRELAPAQPDWGLRLALEGQGQAGGLSLPQFLLFHPHHRVTLYPPSCDQPPSLCPLRRHP